MCCLGFWASGQNHMLVSSLEVCIEIEGVAMDYCRPYHLMLEVEIDLLPLRS